MKSYKLKVKNEGGNGYKTRTAPFVLFFILGFIFILSFISPVYGVDLSCPGGRWVEISQCSFAVPEYYGGVDIWPACIVGNKKYRISAAWLHQTSCPVPSCSLGSYVVPPAECSGPYYPLCTPVSNGYWINGASSYQVYEWQCPSCTNGQTISCYSGTEETKNKGECKAGTQTCSNGQWGACVGEVLPSAEVCGNNIDENCDGNKDEGCETCEVSVKVSPLAVWPQKTESAETTAIVTVSPTKPVPPEGCNIKLSVEPVKNSGGHIDEGHSGTRHKGTISPSSFKIEGGIIAALFTYKSSEVAGMEKIKAEANGKEAGEAIIRVQVSGLQSLSGGYYFLKCEIEPCPSYKHEDFYNVQAWVNGLFNKIAYSYYQKFPTAQLLVVTDASLAYGGLYDYQNTWAPPHKTHRVGTDIDVRSKNIPKKDSQRKVDNRQEFESIVCRNYGYPKLEFPGQVNEHYHLYFFPYKNVGKLCKGDMPI